MDERFRIVDRDGMWHGPPADVYGIVISLLTTEDARLCCHSFNREHPELAPWRVQVREIGAWEDAAA